MNRVLFVAVLGLFGCHRASAVPTPRPLGDRPYGLDVPKSYDPATPTPLLLALHGYGDRGSSLSSASLPLSHAAFAEGVIVAHPDGTEDSRGRRFWNATDACCNFEDKAVDDVAYLNAVIDDVAAHYNVDATRIWAVGFSNGGFMVHRLACERGSRFAAVVSLAGATWQAPERCAPGGTTSVLELHGTADTVVAYDGAESLLGHGHAYPSARATTEQTARLSGCEAKLEDVLVGGAGKETPDKRVRRERSSGCPKGIDIELWTMAGAEHSLQPASAWSDSVLAWLMRHSRRS